MNSRVLLGLVGLIIAIVSTAYFFVAPYARDAAPQGYPRYGEEDRVRSTKESSPTMSSPVVQQTDASVNTMYSRADIALHTNEASCWTAIDGGVFDLTSFIHEHPGGAENILKICGIDGSEAFNAQHGGGPKQENLLAEFRIGDLQE